MSSSHENCGRFLNSPATLGKVRERFDRADYTEPAILDRLGATELPSFRRRVQALPYHLCQTRSNTLLDVFVRLFLLRQPVSSELVAAAVAPMTLEDWEAAGPLHMCPTEVASTAEVTPYHGLLVTAGLAWHRRERAGACDGVAATTRAAGPDDDPPPCASCSGLGDWLRHLAQLLAATHGDRVCGVDLNSRAIKMACVSNAARLNGVTNVEHLCGELLQAGPQARV